MAAAGSGFQAAMMAPTEILASQTHAKLQGLLDRMPDDMQPRAAILTGSTRAKERREVRHFLCICASQLCFLISAMEHADTKIILHMAQRTHAQLGQSEVRHLTDEDRQCRAALPNRQHARRRAP